MAVCDSVGNYILFETNSRQPTRKWARAETSGTDSIGPRVREKLKFTVLKNPASTIKGPLTSCLSGAYRVQVGVRLYAIDPAIYSALKASLDISPATTLGELQARIAEVRVQTNTRPSLATQLADVPLSQYRKRYTYATADSVNEGKGERIAFDFGYTVGALVYNSIIDQVIQSTIKPLYPESYIATPQFLYVAPNLGCGGATQIKNMYPGGTADRFGTPLLSSANISDFRRNNVGSPYYPMLVFLTPANDRAHGGIYVAKAGVLIGFDARFTTTDQDLKPLLAANSELIFVPVLTRLEQVTYLDYPPGMGINLEATNGGSDLQSSFTAFNATVLQSYVAATVNKALKFRPAPFRF